MDIIETLAESSLVRLVVFMEWDSASPGGMEIAAKITDLQKDELDKFLREHLRRRDLHRVVANLNESVLSNDASQSNVARRALERLGFTD